MILPFPVLVKSKIQRRKKLAFLALLALGIFITIIQVIRIQTIKSLANYLDSASLIMWSTVENNLGIIVGSMPTLMPLFRYYAEKSQKCSSSSDSQPRSDFALKSIRRSNRQGSIPLGSGGDGETGVAGSFGGGSEDFILGDVGSMTKGEEVTGRSGTSGKSEF